MDRVCRKLALQPGERVRLLNEQEVEYRPGFLAITDGRGPVALGGVMGGADTMVGEATTEVFFEAAFFHPEAVQGKARDLGLTSDAAYRFERGVDFGATRAALERATELALSICGGSAGPVTEAKGNIPVRKTTRVRTPRVLELLGYPIADREMADTLRRLSCDVAVESEAMRATPPTWRFDLEIEEDFVEEIARIHGYEHVPAEAPRSRLAMLPLREGERDRFDLRHSLAASGYQEVVNYSFVPPEWEADFAGNASPVRLANPIASHMSVMRSSLIGGLVQSLRSNLNRGEERVRVFEIGRCFEGTRPDLAVQPERVAGLAFGLRWPEQWGEKGALVDFFDAKGDLQALAAGRRLDFVPGSHPAFHPGRCALVRASGKALGAIGEMHPRLQQKYELPSPPVMFEVVAGPLIEGEFPRFAGLSRMPLVRRDLALVVDDGVAAGALLEAVRGTLPGFVREVEVFDQYRGKGVEAGKKSLALRIVMQDTDRTLTDSEVEEVVASIREQLNEKFQAKPRT